MFSYVKKILAGTILAAALAASIHAQEMDMKEIKEINFGIISTDSSQNLIKGFEPFLKDMEKAIGIKCNAFFASDYAGVIEAMRFKKVHIAWYGNKSAIEAVDRASGEVFVQTQDVSGNPGYWSLIITHKDSPLNSIDDILKNAKDLNFGNGDVNSTSGYLIPSFYLWGANNIDPVKTFKTVRNANHAANLMAVAMKQVDFATNNTENFDKFAKENPEKVKDIKILWKSPLIPSDPLVWRKDLPKELKARIKGFVLSYGRIAPNQKELERQLKVLAGMSSGFAPFIDAGNEMLLPVREINYAKKIMDIENDANMKDDQKKIKIQELKTLLSELKQAKDLIAKF